MTPPGPAAEPIATGRLLLEPLAVEHAAEMVRVLAAPQLYRFTGGSPPTLPELTGRYRRLVAGPPARRGEGWLNWVIRRREDQRLVGTVQATITADPVTGGGAGGGAAPASTAETAGAAGRASSAQSRGAAGRASSAQTRGAAGPASTAQAPGPAGSPAAGPAGRRAAIAWVVGARWQGRGYAAESAQALVRWLREHGVTTIVAAIHPGHAASAAVARRAGLAPTAERADGEIIWRLAAGGQAGETVTRLP
jgi:RimJ/RimL family protein N-acetyltransferase